MPELAAAYTVGFLSSLLLTTVFYLLWSRYQQRTEALTLYENLKTVDVYWSDREDRLKAWSEVDFEVDQKKAARSLIATSVGLSFLSWVGFAFILLLMLSYRFLARSRFEKRLFASDLATRARMPRNEVESVLKEIRTEFPAT